MYSRTFREPGRCRSLSRLWLSHRPEQPPKEYANQSKRHLHDAKSNEDAAGSGQLNKQASQERRRYHHHAKNGGLDAENTAGHVGADGR